MAVQAFQVGTAQSVPGAYAYGVVPVLDLPTGGQETIPVIVAQGREDGPVLWVTANIHGGELTGIASIHRLVAQNDLPQQMRGTAIFLPTINPAGLRVMQRYPYYEQRDPNRVWPAPRGEDASTRPPGIYEAIASVVYQLIVDSKPAALLDLHNASIDSIPFTIRDRVLYRDEDQRGEAEELARKLDGLAKAFGLSLVNESAAAKYVDLQLHRSVAGSVVNTARVPALTLELGMGMAIHPPAVAAGTRGIENVLRYLGMLDGPPQPIEEVPVVDLGFPVRRDDSARAPVSGLVEMLVEPSQSFKQGDLLGRMLDIYGRPLEGGEIRASAAGWLIGWSNGIAKYRGQ
ncbi:MAG TPA: succinylglutamate desuccinylase/aspartoacylase family protein, partial [Thermomicrobiaceae bacterium]|nr:succinylglutamate desuccinylase/aspartoacylase family protein [Thermomicrobiaceae bacterium]